MPEAERPRELNPGAVPDHYHEPSPDLSVTISNDNTMPVEEVVRAGLNIGTRLPNGKIVTLVHEGALSGDLTAILQQAMRAALARWDLCPHVENESVWCIPAASGRIVCERCALHEDRSWHRGAPCALCGIEQATLAFHVLVARLPGWPGAWTTSIFTNLCPACVLCETGLHVVL